MLRKLLKEICKHKAIEKLEKSFTKKGVEIKIVNNSAISLIIMSLHNLNNGAVGIICNNEKKTGELKKDLIENYKEKSLFLDDYKTDINSVQGFISEERENYERGIIKLQNKEPLIYITNDEALKYSIEGGENREIEIETNKKINKKELVEKLLELGLEETDKCIGKNMFSVRGGIIDIYPITKRNPFRIELFGNQVESLRIFDPNTQQSTEKIKKTIINYSSTNTNKEKPIKLEEIFNRNIKKILYITKESIKSNKYKNENLKLYVEDIDFKNLTKKLKNDKIKEIAKRNRNTFIFNPGKRETIEDGGVFETGKGLDSSFEIPDLGIACVSLGRISIKTEKIRYSNKINNLDEIKWGDFLVHQDYGIGIYRGLTLVTSGKQEEENIKIEYAEGGNVFVPINKFSRVHKYVGAIGSKVNISKLGTGAWEKQKLATKKSAESIVEHLIGLYKTKSEPRGFKYVWDSEIMEKLGKSFPHTETPDQLRSIKDVYNDMKKKTPMDRLLYGDVGYGKTEVAIRAGMFAITSNKCVFLLTPTTILSDQHYIACKNRLEPLGVNVALLSRFKTKKEQLKIIENIRINKVDMVIGTHRLLSGDVPVENLGLLIVDEEHRFGVKNKEEIRKLKSGVDVLTLTATPIPRTLQQSLVGIRNTSKIETAPQSRLPIKTYIKHFDWDFLGQIIKQELVRGGQIYFLHNDIKSLPFVLDKINEMIPDAKAVIAHGKTPSKELEKNILSFFDGGVDILICTTIIESGLDVQNANTIIINNAQNFGLSQLYQIRGRVGRAEKQGYCYLCIPRGVKLLPDAFQRLSTLEHHTKLGSGYNIATKDLEIRGAGNLFGYEQSGQILKVGFELYNKILMDTVVEKRGIKTKKGKEKIIISFGGSAHIEESFMPLIEDRLYFYQEIAKTQTTSGLVLVKNEVIDRFGQLPTPIKNLFKISRVQCLFYDYPVLKCKIDPGQTVLLIGDIGGRVDGGVFLKTLCDFFVEKNRILSYKNKNGLTLQLSYDTISYDDSFSFLEELVNLFSGVFSR